ncbi:MAG: cation:dicarboxylase symporter family transporter [Planctomycetota bacterium]
MGIRAAGDGIDLSGESLRGDWDELRPAVVKHFKKIEKADLDGVEGRRARLVGVVAEKYDFTDEVARQRVERFERAHARESLASWVSWMGTIFIRLLKMVIVPLIATSIISGVGGLGQGGGFGRLFGKTLTYYMLTSFVAICVGLVLVNTIQPGVGATLDLTEGTFEREVETTSLWEVVVRMIPENPVQAAAEGQMLGLIFFSILFGLAINWVEPRYSQKIHEIVDAAFQVMMGLTSAVMRLIPFGVFGLIVGQVASTGLEPFKTMGWYALTITAALFVHFFVVLPLVLLLIARVKPLDHYRNMASALATAFSTSSSSATLPVTISCIEGNSKVSNKISSFVLPLGATINMDGTALYECIGAIFICQVLQTDLSWSEQFMVMMTALLASVGAAGVPSAGLVMIFIVLSAIGLDGNPNVGPIVALMLAVDRPLDMMRTAVNVFSDSVVTVTVAKSEPGGILEEPATT